MRADQVDEPSRLFHNDGVIAAPSSEKHLHHGQVRADLGPPVIWRPRQSFDGKVQLPSRLAQKTLMEVVDSSHGGELGRRAVNRGGEARKELVGDRRLSDEVEL